MYIILIHYLFEWYSTFWILKAFLPSLTKCVIVIDRLPNVLLTFYTQWCATCKCSVQSKQLIDSSGVKMQLRNWEYALKCAGLHTWSMCVIWALSAESVVVLLHSPFADIVLYMYISAKQQLCSEWSKIIIRTYELGTVMALSLIVSGFSCFTLSPHIYWPGSAHLQHTGCLATWDIATHVTVLRFYAVPKYLIEQEP